MADQTDRIQIQCPNCGRVLATVPQGFRLQNDLVCPGCGATLSPPGAIGRITDAVKEAFERIGGPAEEDPR